MDFETWIAFATACLILSVIPGPSVMVVTAQSISRGLRAAMICIAGEVLGGLCLVLLSLIGVGTILATSALLFQIVKWLGVGYLVFLGLRQVTGRADPNTGAGAKTTGTSFWSGFITALFNPKSIVFYLAFLAQFVDPDKSLPVQYAELMMTSSSVAATVLFGYAVMASRVRRVFNAPRMKRAFRWATGGLYFGSALAATAR